MEQPQQDPVANLRKHFQTQIQSQGLESVQSQFDSVLLRLYPDTNILNTLLKQVDDLKRGLDSFRPFGLQATELQIDMQNEFTQRSNQLSGNVLTLGETISVLDDEILKDRPFRDQVEATNHQQALEYLHELLDEHKDFSLDVLKQLHFLVMRDIDTASGGLFRTEPTQREGRSQKQPEALRVPELVEHVFGHYQTQRPFQHPLLLAADTSAKIFELNPFGEASGIVSRLVLNFLLMQAGYPILLLARPEHQHDYYSALEHLRQQHDPEPFQLLVLQEVKRTSIRSVQAFAMYTSCSELNKGDYFFRQLAKHTDILSAAMRLLTQ